MDINSRVVFLLILFFSPFVIIIFYSNTPLL